MYGNDKKREKKEKRIGEEIGNKKNECRHYMHHKKKKRMQTLHAPRTFTNWLFQMMNKNINANGWKFTC